MHAGTLQLHISRHKPPPKGFQRRAGHRRTFHTDPIVIEEPSPSGGGYASGLEIPRKSVLRGSTRRSRLAVNQVTTYRWSLLQDVIGYREAGIDAIGLWRSKVADFGEERAVELIRDSGLAVSSLSWGGGFTGGCGWSFEDSIADAQELIDLAAQLRAECVVLVSGPRAGHTWNHARRLVVEALKRLGEDASRTGVRLGLEPMRARFWRNWTFLNSIEQTLEVLDACRIPEIGMVFDTSQLRAETSLLERIPQIAPRVVSVQLNDYRETQASENDACLPGDGLIPVAEIGKAFLDSGYRGFFEIEAWSEELWGADYIELLECCRSRLVSLGRTDDPSVEITAKAEFVDFG